MSGVKGSTAPTSAESTGTREIGGCESMGHIAEHRQCPNCHGGHTKRLDFAFKGYRVTEDRVCRDCQTEFTTMFELEEQTIND